MAAARPTSRPSRNPGGNRWILPLGTYAGIPVELHASFVALVAFVAWSRWGEGALEAGLAVAGLLAIFTCVVLHEYGHALAARRYGIGTHRITLLPIGGVAQLEGLPSEPSQELVVALAGPLVNLVIALLAGTVWLAGSAVAPGALEGLAGSALGFLTVSNGMIFLFNLLPAFPMDGGRVLRAALARRRSAVRATEIAALVGRVFAILFAIVGLFSNPFLILIAAFVWMGAGAEARQTRLQAELESLTVGGAMSRTFVRLSPGQRLGDVLAVFGHERQGSFPVVEDERVIGVLLRSDLDALVRERRMHAELTVRDVMRTGFEPLVASESLSAVAPRIFREPAGLPVLEGSRLVGWLTRDGVRDYLALHRRFRATGEASGA